MKQFLLLLKGTRELDYSPEELDKRLNEYRAWIQTIKKNYLADNRLAREGAHIRQNRVVATDGPFLESKEIIAGFIYIQAEDLEQATSIAKNCPLLRYFEIFVRPIINSGEP